MQEGALASLTPEEQALRRVRRQEPTAEQSKLQQGGGRETATSAGEDRRADRQGRSEKGQPGPADWRRKYEAAPQARVRHFEQSRRGQLQVLEHPLRPGANAGGARRRRRWHCGQDGVPEKAIPKAKDDYEKSFDLWAEALDKFPELPADSSTGSDLMDVIEEYSKVLEQQDLSLEDPEVADRFPLWNIVRANDQMNKFEAATQGLHVRVTGFPAEGKTLINPADALID